MARFKDYNYDQTKMIPISFDRQILPGTFEHSLTYLIENERKRSTNRILSRAQLIAIVCIFTFQGNNASTSSTLAALGSSLKT